MDPNFLNSVTRFMDSTMKWLLKLADPANTKCALPFAQ